MTKLKIKQNSVFRLFGFVFILITLCSNSNSNTIKPEISVSGKLSLRNDSLYLKVSFKNETNDNMALPEQYLSLVFYANKNHITSTNTVLTSTKISYPEVVVKKFRRKKYNRYCIDKLDTKNYPRLDKDEVLIEYNLTKMGYSYMYDYSGNLACEIYASDILEDYCPSIWTGKIRFDIHK